MLFWISLKKELDSDKNQLLGNREVGTFCYLSTHFPIITMTCWTSHYIFCASSHVSRVLSICYK